MNQVIVFGSPQSTYVRTVRMALEEKGVSYRLEPVKLRDPEHRSRHPFGKMPAFEHGSVKLYETSAITHYVNESFPGPSLIPRTPLGRALMHQWISAVIDYIYPPMVRRYVLEYLRPSGPDGQPDRNKIEAALVDLRHHLGVIDATLQEQEYLAGDELSLADLFLLPIISYVANLPEGKEALQAAPHVTRWHAQLAGRPSYQATRPPPVTKAS